MKTNEEIKAEYDERIATLAEYLRIDVNKIDKIDVNGIYELEYKDKIFVVDKNEYMILNDGEARQLLINYIRRSLLNLDTCIFKSRILADHTDDPYMTLYGLKMEFREEISPILAKLTSSIEIFMWSVVYARGREYFLASDGKEIRMGEYFIYRIN